MICRCPQEVIQQLLGLTASHSVLIFVVGRFHGWNCILGGDRDVFRDVPVVLPLPPFLLHLDKSVDMSRDGKTGCQDMSRWWSRCGFWAECFQNLQIARQKFCFGCRDKQEVFQSVTQIPYHPCHGGFTLRYFSLFFTACQSLLSIFFRKRNRYVRSIHLRFPGDFPTKLLWSPSYVWFSFTPVTTSIHIRNKP